MELRATFQIPTLVKAMTDVVLPAVDPQNKLAQEQAQLIIGSLSLMAQRLPLQYRYDRHELQSFVSLAGELEQAAGDAPEVSASVDALQTVVRQGQDVLSRAGAEPVELEQANLELRHAVGQVIQASLALPDTARRGALEQAVMAHGEAMLQRERSWLAPQGWEGKDTTLPPLDELIGR